MKLITRNTDYAIRALCFIAKEKDDIISVRELVKCLKVPRPFLRKILQILNKNGLLKSYKGQGGGFSLAVSPKKIFVADLIEIFQKGLKLNKCVFKKATCPDINICPLKEKIDDIEGYMVSKLKALSIAALLKRR